MNDTIIPPTFTVEDEMERMPKPASLIRRFVALLLDYFVLWISFSIFMALIVFSASLGGIFALPSAIVLSISTTPLSITFVGSLLGWFYFAGMQSSFLGGTVGKLMMGLRVTDEQGARLTFSQASLRYWVKILLSTILLIGYFLAFLTRRKQSLHDLIAKTLVIRR